MAFIKNAGDSILGVHYRFPRLVKPYRRKSDRLEKTLNVIAVAEGGESGARTANSMGMQVSADTMLRQIRKAELPTVSTPKILGVDEFSFKRGQRYATILIDLEKHKRVDVLPDRSAESFAQWLKEHPGVEIISRDRGQIYADGGRQGAPNAIHVADRFHLVENIREAIERTFSSNYKEIKETAKAFATQTTAKTCDILTPELESLSKQDLSNQKPSIETEGRENATSQKQVLAIEPLELTEKKLKTPRKGNSN